MTALELRCRSKVVSRILDETYAKPDHTTRHAPDTLIQSWLGGTRQRQEALESIEVQLLSFGIEANPRLSLARGDEIVTFTNTRLQSARRTIDKMVPADRTQPTQDIPPHDGREVIPVGSIDNPNAATITVEPADLAIDLYPFQSDAVKALRKATVADRSMTSRNPFAGLLVLPTGAGKTLTAAYWLLSDVIDKSGKVLWIAHRHELLNQAAATFTRLACRTVLKNRNTVRYRIISGMHDRPVNLRPDDDLVYLFSLAG